jgi:LPXTG-motif cell wall-anchored protein
MVNAEEMAMRRWNILAAGGGWVRAGIAAAAGAALFLAATPTPALASGGTFTTFAAPLTGNEDYLTGFPNFGIGPVGTRVEATRAFAVDFANGITYRFPAAGGNVSDPGVVSFNNGLNGGLTKLGNTYYAVIQGGSDGGVWTMDPDTLHLVTKVTGFPPGVGNFRDVIANAVTGELWVSGSNGVFRFNPSAAPVSLTQVTNLDTDGLGISGDGKTMYGASAGNVVYFFNATTGAELNHVTVGHGIDGIATSGDDIYANSNDGTIERIDHTTLALTVVASGGSRGDFVTVGPDGSLYATQSDRVVRLTPAVFNQPPASPTPTPSPSAAAVAAPTLPTTGDRIALTITTGAVLVIGGVLVLWLMRRRRATPVAPGAQKRG